MSLYPNPNTDMATIQLTEEIAKNQTASDQNIKKSLSSGIVKIQLWSATSLLRRFTTDQDTYQFSVADLPKGMYFVRVIKDGKIYTQKLIKN